MLHIARAVLCQSSLGWFLGCVPGITRLYRDWFWVKKINLFFGIFDSYEDAAAASPKFARNYSEGIVRDFHKRYTEGRPDIGSWAKLRQSSVFPVCLWLGKLIKRGDLLVDYGGGSGQTYNEYVKYRDLPDDVRWAVYDLPDVLEHSPDAPNGDMAGALFMTDKFEDVHAPDILISCGCAQYLEFGIEQFLDRFSKPARHVIVNKVPFHERGEFFTLQNLGSEAVPYRVFNRATFVAAFEGRGYRLIDEWPCDDLSVAIPFAPDHLVNSLTGMVFEYRGDN